MLSSVPVGARRRGGRVDDPGCGGGVGVGGRSTFRNGSSCSRTARTPTRSRRILAWRRSSCTATRCAGSRPTWAIRGRGRSRLTGACCSSARKSCDRPRCRSVRVERSETDLRDIPQVIPFGIERVGALASRTARIDGRQDPLDVDIAVIDSGVESSNSDLRVVSGVDCVPGGDASTEDLWGHGTHVAGIAAARDNAYGVVGVAPGARIWPIRVLGSDGYGNDSWVLCGVDWVAKNADQIDVANMSLGDIGADDGKCGRTDQDPLHLAICNSVAAGVTDSVSAGNDAERRGNRGAGGVSRGDRRFLDGRDRWAAGRAGSRRAARAAATMACRSSRTSARPWTSPPRANASCRPTRAISGGA